MDIVVNEELKAYIDPLTPAEYEALERSLLAEGCRDALVLWGDVLVDGHNRYGICRKHGLPFQTVQHPRFTSIEDVHLWMIDQHLGRRSVSDFQRGVLALRKREIIAERRARHAALAPAAAPLAASETAPAETAAAPSAQDALETREALAKAARLSSNQVVLIEKIQKQGVPALLAAVKAGSVSLNAAAAVATLPSQQQAAAAAAGAEELRQAAKRVRQARRKPPEGGPAQAAQVPEHHETPAVPASAPTLDTLRQRVAALEAENLALREELAALKACRALIPAASSCPAPSPPVE